MAKLYFISRVVHEFYRLDEEAFTVGGCFNAHNHEEEVIDVYDSRRLAERRFKPYRTHMSRVGKNIIVEEYAIIEREYDFKAMIKDYDELRSKFDCIEALKKNLFDYNDYETCYEDVIECSPRLYTGYVEWDDMQKTKAFSSQKILSAGLAADEITLKSKQYFVVGDNYNNSEDSRSASVGNIKRTNIIGKVGIKYWPW